MSPESRAAGAAPSDPFAQFKANQREGWSHFGPLAVFTTPPAARLVRFAGITAARLGAVVTGSDLTPELLEQARENANIAGVQVDWREADAEALPFADGEFDVVISQFGHMFAPRPDVATAEMLRVLRPGGRIAFSTWPPDHFTGRMFALTARYSPPPPAGAVSPVLWGEPSIVRERLGDAIRDLTFERDLMMINTLSPQHVRFVTERSAGPVRKLAESLSVSDPERLEEFRREYDALATQYFEMNTMRQSYLMTRAFKA